jgi:ATP-dependent Clp protease ATP-binding subunit ClpB
LEKRLEDQQLQLKISTEARQLLAREGYDPQFGARPLKRTIQSMVLDPLAMRMLEGEFAPGDSVLADVQDDALVFSCTTKSEV